MKVSRRTILTGAALGGGLVVAWTLLPRDFASPLAPQEGEVAFDAWLKIGDDGVVTVAVPQLEMGQGVTTILPQIVAMELGADWRQVAVEPAPVSGAYANLPLAAAWSPLWRPYVPDWADEPDDRLLRRWAQDENFTVTADGSSLAAYEQPCREAGASARAMLCMAAADRWGVPWEQCDAAGGFVVHDEKRLSFAELVAEAAGYSPPDPPPLRPQAPAEMAPLDAGPARTPAFPRLDLPSKVDGSHVFAADVRLPDMVFAAIRHGPLDKAELGQFNQQAAAAQMGLIKLVRGKRWLAAIADNWWAAEEALKKIAPRFVIERPVQSAAMNDALDHAAREVKGQVVEKRGRGDEDYAPDLALRYDVAPALHAGIETTSVTARLSGGLLELWAATQAPQAFRKAAAKTLGIALGKVVLYPVAAGGSFDARLETQAAIAVALIAREAGRPVQLTWSRWQEAVTARPRPPVAAYVGARLGPEGSILQLRARLAAPSTNREFGRRLFDDAASFSAISETAGEADPMVCAGLMQSYNIPDIAVSHVPVKLALPTGRMRSQAHGYTCFFRESFIDEVAIRYQREPLSYRISMLGQDAKMVDCLQRAARLAEWDGGTKGSGQGLACHEMQFGNATARIALIASAGAGEGGLRVRKMSACVDIGRVVNRDIALQQLEGGLIFGLGLALGCATEYEDGLPTHARLSQLRLPGLADCPEIEIELMDSDAPPFDPGEIGVPPVAPAIANAFFSATGIRLRRLPLLSASI